MGWFGALIAYLALDVVATAGSDLQTVRAAYVAMALLTDTVVLPAAVASVLVGTLLALGSRWGLLQHYWVLIKLLLTVLATTVLMIEVSKVRTLAVAAVSAADPRVLPGTLPHSIGGLLVLTVVLVLSVLKPRGLTRYGWRRARTTRPAP